MSEEKNIIEWLRKPENISYLAVLVALHDKLIFEKKASLTLDELIGRVMIPIENLEKILRELHKRGLIELNHSIRLTKLALDLLPLIRWGRKA